ncbi:ABC transporter substrate-binding protein [Amycolatopsis sp. NPDC059021]|uniref:ABC transporter substrate-binding protein n=1 Tax=Amycolatopsis sp. NPDC059021 TaxID=3346704 RepID=UPI00366C1494
MIVLRGMAWGHQRGIGCLRAVSTVYTEANPEVSVVWDSRSLQDFEDMPITELADRYDLIAMDHPYVGQAQTTEALLPLEKVMSAGSLAAQRAGSAGPSYASYTWAGSQWAVAMDAAAQTTAYRPDVLGQLGWNTPPRTWDGVFELLKSLPRHRKAVIPANPTHLLGSLLTLCAQQAGTHEGWTGRYGLRPDVAVPATIRLQRLLGLADAVSWTSDPIQTLEAMRSGDTVAYSPMIFGYVNYSRVDSAGNSVRYADIPSLDGAPAGSLLGGVGLTISSRCAEPEAAARFLEYVVSPECQTGEYVRSGGQPGHRAAWTNPAIDAHCGNFFSRTLSTLDHAFVRPRDPAYPSVHHRAGLEIHRLARQGASAVEIVRRFNDVCLMTYASAGL